MNDTTQIIGYPKEWELFYERHGDFSACIHRLAALSDALFSDQPKAIDIPGKVVFALGCCVWEDARELFVLAGNGLGNGAQKILRSLYEHAVTAAYLAKHPEEAEAFQNYFFIQHDKFIVHLSKFKEWAVTITPEKCSEIKALNAQYRAQFRQTPCCKCDRTPQMSWTKKSTEQIATEAGDGWDVFYLPAFFYPTSHVHATSAGLFSRMITKDGKAVFTGGPAQSEADSALRQAHILLLWAFRTQIDYFEMHNLRSELEAISADVCRVWHLEPFQESSLSNTPT